jgi:hypothetical protein
VNSPAHVTSSQLLGTTVPKLGDGHATLIAVVSVHTAVSVRRRPTAAALPGAAPSGQSSAEISTATANACVAMLRPPAHASCGCPPKYRDFEANCRLTAETCWASLTGVFASLEFLSENSAEAQEAKKHC